MQREPRVRERVPEIAEADRRLADVDGSTGWLPAHMRVFGLGEKQQPAGMGCVDDSLLPSTLDERRGTHARAPFRPAPTIGVEFSSSGQRARTGKFASGMRLAA